MVMSNDASRVVHKAVVDIWSRARFTTGDAVAPMLPVQVLYAVAVQRPEKYPVPRLNDET
jgi:hypothetical protein